MKTDEELLVHIISIMPDIETAYIYGHSNSYLALVPRYGNAKNILFEMRKRLSNAAPETKV
jgi:hypothetical protein